MKGQSIVGTKKQKKTNALAFAEKMLFISKKQLVPSTAMVPTTSLLLAFYL